MNFLFLFLCWLLILVCSALAAGVAVKYDDNGVASLDNMSIVECVLTCWKEKQPRCKFFKFRVKDSDSGTCYLTSNPSADVFKQYTTGIANTNTAAIQPPIRHVRNGNGSNGLEEALEHFNNTLHSLTAALGNELKDIAEKNGNIKSDEDKDKADIEMLFDAQKKFNYTLNHLSDRIQLLNNKINTMHAAMVGVAAAIQGSVSDEHHITPSLTTPSTPSPASTATLTTVPTTRRSDDDCHEGTMTRARDVEYIPIKKAKKHSKIKKRHNEKAENKELALFHKDDLFHKSKKDGEKIRGKEDLGSFNKDKAGKRNLKGSAVHADIRPPIEKLLRKSRAPSEVCPSHYTRSATKVNYCFLCSTYTMTAQAAADYCTKLSGVLVVIHSLDKDKAVQTFLKRNHYDTEEVWFSPTRSTEEELTWTSDASSVDYKNFIEEEEAPVGRACTLMDVTSGQWKRLQCDEAGIKSGAGVEKHRVICQPDALSELEEGSKHGASLGDKKDSRLVREILAIVSSKKKSNNKKNPRKGVGG